MGAYASLNPGVGSYLGRDPLKHAMWHKISSIKIEGR